MSLREIENKDQKKKWCIRASHMARYSENTIRKIIENMKIEPNPEKSMIALSIGDPTTFGNLNPPEELMVALRSAIEHLSTRSYSPAAGQQAAREAVAWYSAHQAAPGCRPPRAEDVILSSGCSHAIDMAISALADAGQNVLVPRPGFLIYKTLAEGLGIKIKYYNLLPNQQWQADLLDLENNIDDNTAAIIVTNPSNPCGSVYSKKHLKEILDVASRNCVPIIADEIYEHMVFSGNEYTSICTLSEDVPILMCGGTTKRFLVPGWRLGWVIVHDRNDVFQHSVRQGLTNLSQRLLGPSGIVQVALPAILTNTPQYFFDSIVQYVETNAKIAYDHLARVKGLTPSMPQGAMYMMIGIDLDLFPKIENDLQFVEQMVKEQSVFCLPGMCFGTARFFRIVLTVPEEILFEACLRIAEFCNQHSIPDSTKFRHIINRNDVNICT